ncbi:hypothetical protein JCM11251_000078 [Rhodosporidiobolus azoricus]
MVLTRSHRDPAEAVVVTSTIPLSHEKAGGRAAPSPPSLDSMHPTQPSYTSVDGPFDMYTQQLSHSSGEPPLPVNAQAPGSPLFGAGEDGLSNAVGQSGVEKGMLSVVAGLAGEGFGGNAMEQDKGESTLPDYFPSLREIFPSSPPYVSDDEEGDSFAVPKKPCAYPTPVSPRSTAAYLPFPVSAGEDYSALFNDLLTSNGLSHLITDAPIPAFPSSGFGFSSLPSTTSTTTSVPSSYEYDPRTRHYALDAQLGSPLLAYDAASPLSYAGSPAFPSSNEASPAWGGGDDWSGSPAAAAFYSNCDSNASAGVSPALGELDLFGEYAGSCAESGGDHNMSTKMTSHGFTAAPAGFDNVDGATSTGASYVHTTMGVLPPLPSNYPALFSPVVPSPSALPPRLGTLTPVISDNDDADVSPQLLPPPLPALAASAAVTVKMEEDVLVESTSSASSPEPVFVKPTTRKAATKDASSDDDYVPGTSSISTTKRSPRRVSTTKAASPTPAPLPGVKVALSAPITKRSYAVESRTSAKPIPKSLQKKMDAARRRGEDVDEREYVDEASRKRKANTLSARESRAKKAQRVAELEELERRYEGEKGEWEDERRGLMERIGELEGELEAITREVKRVRRG